MSSMHIPPGRWLLPHIKEASGHLYRALDLAYEDTQRDLSEDECQLHLQRYQQMLEAAEAILILHDTLSVEGAAVPPPGRILAVSLAERLAPDPDPYTASGTTLTAFDRPHGEWHPARVPAAPYLQHLRRALLSIGDVCRLAFAEIPQDLLIQARLTAWREHACSLEIDDPAARRHARVNAVYWTVQHVVFRLEREGAPMQPFARMRRDTA